MRRDPQASLTRRGLLTASAAAFVVPVSGHAAGMLVPRAVASTIDAPFSDPPALMVAGPEGCPLDPWAVAIKSTVDRQMASGQMMRISHVGGIDGVTAANQFEARTAPDGATVLLVSGLPAIAWLVGDPRAQFDTGRWLPLATGLCSGVVLRRAGRAPAGPVRLACVSADQDLAARLGLSLLGIETSQTIESTNVVATLLAGEADVGFVRGPGAVAATRIAMASGAVPMFGLGAPDDQGHLIRDPALPDIRILPEVVLPRTASAEQALLLQSWRAVAAATRLEFALILPWLTPAGTVAWWRRIGAQLATAAAAPTPADGLPEDAPSLRVGAAPSGSFGLAALATDTKTSLTLRLWVAQHSH